MMKASNATFKKNKLPDDAKNKLFFGFFHFKPGFSSSKAKNSLSYSYMNSIFLCIFNILVTSYINFFILILFVVELFLFKYKNLSVQVKITPEIH